jgi:hypothetical protein
MILEEYGFLSESEFDAICESEADAESLLSGYVKRICPSFGGLLDFK